MKKMLCWLLIICAWKPMAQTSYEPQNRFLEAGFLFGLMNYSGDLAEKNIQISETHLGFGGFARYFFSKRFAAKAHFVAGSISGDDAHARDIYVRKRSFRFGAEIMECGLVGEWYPLRINRFSDVGVHRFFIAPYFYLGLGAAFTGARVEYYGPPEDFDKIAAAPLPEFAERQRFVLLQSGLGARVRINEIISLGLEAGARPLFSDKLDGVRLNGNPDKTDWYYFGGASLSFVLVKPKKRG